MTSGNVQLREADILVRPWMLADVVPLAAAVKDSQESLGRWLPWAHPGYGEPEARDWIAQASRLWDQKLEYAFGVFAADDGELLGGVGLDSLHPRHRFGNLGYWVRRTRRRRGVATAATRLAARFGFEHAGLARIEIVAAVDNTASRRVAEKVGARLEGYARNRLVLYGRAVEAALYSLVPTDL
jgi:RimJ/RimL family protein N-acetyltransferase